MGVISRRVVEGVQAVKEIEQYVADSLGKVIVGAPYRMHIGLYEYASRAVGDAAWCYVCMQMAFLLRFRDTLLRRLRTRYTHGDGSSLSDQRARDIMRDVLSSEVSDAATTEANMGCSGDPVLMIATEIQRIQQSIREVCGLVSTCARLPGDTANDLCLMVYSAPEFSTADIEIAIQKDREEATIDGTRLYEQYHALRVGESEGLRDQIVPVGHTLEGVRGGGALSPPPSWSKSKKILVVVVVSILAVAAVLVVVFVVIL